MRLPSLVINMGLSINKAAKSTFNAFQYLFFLQKSDILFSIILKLQTLGFFKKALLKTAVSQLIVSNSIFSILV